MLCLALDGFGQLNGPSQVCSGVANTYYTDIQPDGTSVRIRWSYTGSFVVTNINSTSQSISWTTNGSVTLIHEEREGVKAPWKNFGTYTIQVTVKSPGTISGGNFSTCPSVPFTLYTTGVGDLSWQSSPAGANSWGNVGSGTSINTSINQKTDFRVALTGCPYTSYSNLVTGDVTSGPTSGGSISGGGTICSGSAPSPIVNSSYPNGQAYNYQWQQRPAGGSWAIIAGANNESYSPGQLTQTTDFQRVAAWSCNKSVAFASNPVTISVDQPSSAGTLSSSVNSVYSGGTITLYSTGFVSTANPQWLYRYTQDGGASYTDWSVYANSFSTNQPFQVSSITNKSRTYQFQVTAQNNTCPTVNSNIVNVTVNAANDGNLSIGPTQVCAGVAYTYTSDVQPDNVTVRLNWSYSGGFSVTGVNEYTKNITWTSDGTVTITEQDKEGAGSNSRWVTVGTNTIQVRIKKVGTASSVSGTVCPSNNITLSTDGNGQNLSWQWSPMGTNNWSAFSSGATTGATISQNTDYRVAMNDCGSPVYSNVVTAYVYTAITDGGSIAGGGTICSGSTPGPITNNTYPNGQAYTYQWQQRTAGGDWNSINGATDLSYSPGALYQSTDFQRLAIWSCNNAVMVASNIVTITVDQPSNGGSLSSLYPAVCGNDPIHLSLSGSVGTSTIWYYQYSEDGGQNFNAWTEFSRANGGAQDFSATNMGAIDRVYQFMAVSQNNSCAQAASNILYVTVNSNNMGALSTNYVEAYGVTRGNFSIYGYNGVFQQWQQSTDGGSTWASADGPNTAPSYDYSNITTPTQYRALITNGACSSTSATVYVNVYAFPAITTTGTPALALGSTLDLKAVGTYSTYQWIKNGTDVPGATGATYTAFEPGFYRLRVRANGTAMEATTGDYTLYALGYSPDKFTNKVVTTTIKKQGVTAATNLYTSLQPNEYTQSITYSDALSRPLQNITVGASPQQMDLVQVYVYDTLAQTAYLPYAAGNRDGARKVTALAGTTGSYTSSDQYSFYQNTAKVANSTAPFAKTIVENSPLGRVTEAGAPGAEWQPGQHTVKRLFQTNNTVFKVRLWTANGPNGYYAAGTLAVEKLTDENGNPMLTYTDKLGRTVLKRVKTSALTDTTTWLETYYAYDVRGNVAMQVPPNASSLLNKGTAWSTAFRDRWCFVYTYDGRTRLVQKKAPDQAASYFVYDPLGRLVLTQDGRLRANNQWAFVKYDVKGRAVMTGLYTNASQNTLALIQGQVNGLYTDASVPWYETRGTALHGYTNQSFPTVNADGSPLTVFSVNYYDTYDFDFDGVADTAYQPQGLTGEGAQASSQGMPTGAKKLVLGTSNYLYAYQFYDRFGRVIQTVGNNHLSAALDNRATVVYDFEGKVLLTKASHNAGGTNQYSIIQRTVYDHAGRPLQIYHKINTAAEVLVAQYEYNKLGQVVDKKLHSTDGTNFLQSVDYRYTIRGWLKSINNAQLAVDATNNDEANDYFGMELRYQDADGVGNTPQYNGMVTAAIWKNGGTAAGATDQRSYTYGYDKSGRLLTATFKANTGLDWTKENGTLNENLTYDANGNVLKLARYQNLRGLAGTTVTSTPQAVDNLTYSYANGNQLSKVEDAVATTTGVGDFKNGAKVTTEYNYDATGSLAKDLNKGIDTIIYNVLGKPNQINFKDGRTVTYRYTADGTKLAMAVTANSATTTSDYVGGFVYQNGVLQFFSSPEGRVARNTSGALDYQYALADHQGNTRVIFSAAPPIPTAIKATFEGNANDQATAYANVKNVVTFVAANQTVGGNKVVRMNQNYRVGPSKSVKVFAGDKVAMEVYAYYEQSSGWGTTNAPLTTLITAIAGAFGGAPSGTPDAVNIYNGVKGALGAFGLGANGGDAAPAAFLNYILFDKNYKVMDMGWQAVPTTAKFAKQRLAIPAINVKEAGYLFTYLSYEDQSNNYVYFDDYIVTYTPTNIVQSNEYYPYGLQTASSWTRENATQNNFLANGGTELNTSSGLYDLDFRNYDPALGRMHQTDPMADKYAGQTTYNYAFNSPVNLNDPNGAAPYSTSNQWSADFEESYGGSDYGSRRSRAIRLQHDIGYQMSLMPWATDGDGGDKWGMYGFSDFFNFGGYDTYAEYAQVKAAEKGASVLSDYWTVFDGAGNIRLYNKPTFWNDYGEGTSTNLATQFAAYKNGQGMEYQFPTLNDPLFKFLQGFYEGPKSNSATVSFSANGLGFVGWVGEQATRAQAINGATRAIRLEGSQATKFLGKVVGPGLGFVGVMASSLESAYDENGYTLGDGAKTGIGVLMLLGSLNPITAPFVAGYALADLGLQVFTGTSLTDRIGNGIDNMNGVMLEPK